MTQYHNSNLKGKSNVTWTSADRKRVKAISTAIVDTQGNVLSIIRIDQELRRLNRLITTSDLQQAYNNSNTDPTIITSSVGGAVKLKAGTGDQSDGVIEILDSLGNVIFNVQGNGRVGVGNPTPQGNIDVSKTEELFENAYGLRINIFKKNVGGATGASNILFGTSVVATGNSTVDISSIYGQRTTARHTGTGNVPYLMAAYDIADYTGGGNSDHIYGGVTLAKLTGDSIVANNYIRGLYIDATIDNPNAITGYIQGGHIGVSVWQGDITGAATSLLLDYDPAGTGTVSGEFQYLRIQNDNYTNISGEATAIKSLSTLPSTFYGRMSIGKLSLPTETLDVEGAGLFSSTLTASNLSGANTGDQVLSDFSLDTTNLIVVSKSDIQEFAEGVDHALLKARGTGIDTTYVFAATAGGTTFDVSMLNGEIKSDQGYFHVHNNAETGVTVANLNAPSTYVYLDNTGTIQQQTSIPTRQDWSRKVFVARVAVDLSSSTVIGFEYLNNPIGNYANSIRDIYEYLLAQGVPFKKDMVVTGRTTDLGFDISAGSLLEFGGTGDIFNPNIKTFSGVTNASFFLTTRTGFDSGGNTDLPKFWDNNGSLIALGSTTWVGHRLYKFSNGNICLQYGQGNYANLSLAKAGVASESYEINPILKNATFFGWWFIESIATNTGNTGATQTTAFVEYTIGIQGGSSTDLSGALLKGNNLSDVLDSVAAKTNLGIKFVDGIDPLDAVFTGGKVGIGTTNPSEALSVVGKIDLDFGQSVLIGSGAGQNDDGTNNNNVAVGKESLRLNVLGVHNTALGYRSMYYNTTSNNTGVGYFSLFRVSTGSNNSGFGSSTMSNQTTGDDNVALGSGAGQSSSVGNLTVSNESIFIGRRSESLADNSWNEIVIGYRATGNGNNSVTLGNDDVTKTVLKGKVAIGTTSPSYDLDVSGDGRFTSDLRCLSLIQTSQTDHKESISNISRDKPISIPFKEYVYKSDSGNRKRYGVLAEDIERDYPELVHVDAEGVKGINYIDLLVKRVAELEKELEDISLTEGLKGDAGKNGKNGNSHLENVTSISFNSRTKKLEILLEGQELPFSLAPSALVFLPGDRLSPGLGKE
jgi:hypothetical protein